MQSKKEKRWGVKKSESIKRKYLKVGEMKGREISNKTSYLHNEKKEEK